MQTESRKTPLYEAHLRIGAKIVDFAGWLLPVQFRSIIEEHQAVRASAGAFDISHMGQIRVAGPDAFKLLQAVITNDLASVGAGQSQYNLICSDEGGIIDDTYVFHSGPEEYLLIANAVNAERDFLWLVEHADRAKLGADVDYLRDTRGAVAVQGPRALELLNALAELDLATVPPRQCRQTKLAGVDVLLARVGYTGEDGFEVYAEARETPRIWQTVLDAGAVPCGLGARDTLRLEASLPLYGHEIALTTNPFEAGLGWAVKPNKGEFVGRAALLKAAATGIRRKLICFQVLGRGIPREHYTIEAGGVTVGHVTSGTYSPTLDRGIGMGYVAVERARVGEQVDIIIREKPVKAEIVRRPFYRRREGG